MQIQTSDRVIGNLMENKDGKLTNRFDSLQNKCLNPKLSV